MHLTETEKKILEMFARDENMSEAVFKFLMLGFIEPKEYTSAEMTASHKIALDLLQEVYKQLKKHKNDEDKDRVITNPGL